MPESSRKGRRIASKACDLCRERKVQCSFENEDAESCHKCLKSGVPCTFFTDRKPRGPPSRRIAEAKKRAQLASVLNNVPSPPNAEGPGLVPTIPRITPKPHTVPLPLGRFTIEHLLPEDIFINVIGDYVDRVYPVLPLVHLPTFEAAFRERQYNTDPPFFRLCVALCATTMASIPRHLDTYACRAYADIGQLVERAAHIIMASRVATEPTWMSAPTRDGIIVSVLMTMASHYGHRRNAGWTFASEAVQFFRSLELYQKPAYALLTAVEAEMCKRAFWILYIAQIHNRITSRAPHIGMSYNPLTIEWDFLVPMEVRDELLTADPALLSTGPNADTHRPIISGFIALIKVFLCVGDTVSKVFTGPPPSYAMSAGPLNTRFLPDLANQSSSQAAQFTTPSLETLFTVIRRLHATINNLPEELRLPKQGDMPISSLLADPSPVKPPTSPVEPARQIDGASPPSFTDLSKTARQFEIMRVNIHVTSLYFQSALLEVCLDKLKERNRSSHPPASSMTSPVGSGVGADFAAQDPLAESAAMIQLWEFRENLASQLLDVVSSSSQETLEANGHSMITKIRGIAASLLAEGEGERIVASDIDERNRQYVARFAEILAKLDYASRSLQGWTVDRGGVFAGFK